MEIQASLPVDGDGFISRECPTCLGRFKAPISEGNIVGRFCPYCGHEGEGCWWTPEQLEYMRALAINAIQPELDSAFGGLEQSNGLISITVDRSPPPAAVAPAEHDGGETRNRCSECGTEVKLELSRLLTAEGASAPFTCLECGEPNQAAGA